MKPTHSTSFDARIRDACVRVDADAWADHEGIYKTSIRAVWLDVTDVMGLLTDADILELDAMIPEAIFNDYADLKG